MKPENIKVWHIEHDGEYFTVAADTAEEALRLLEDECWFDGEVEREEAVVSEITDEARLTDKNILSERHNGEHVSIVDILEEATTQFPIIISTTAW